MKNSSFRFPLPTVIIYTVAGFIWILLSDRFLGLIATDVQTLTSLQTYKGWIFVLASAVLIYTLLFREFKLLNKALNKQIEAEETIKKERDLLRRINDTIPVGLTLVGSNGEITLANHQAEKILGLKRDEITQRSYNASDWKITDFHGNPFPVENLPFSLVVKTHQPVFDVQHAIEWKGGKRVLLSINASPLISASGDFDGMVSSIEDITEKALSEEALRESEARWQSYVSDAPNVIFTADKDFKITFINYTLPGYLLEDVLGVSIFNFLPEESKDIARITLDKVFATGDKQSYEALGYGIHGEPVWYSTSVGPIKKDGKIYSLIFVTTDITERKRAEESLQQSEYLLRAIIDNAPFGAHNYELNSNGQLIFIGANKVADTILHIDNQQFIGKTIEDAFPLLVQTEIPNIYKRVAQTGESYHVEQVDYNEKNIRGAFDVHAMGIGPNRMSAFFLDITERKRAEEAMLESKEKYRKLIETTDTGYVIIDEYGIVVDANQQYINLTGYNRLDEILSHNVLEWTTEDCRARNIEAVKECLAKGLIRNLEVEYVHKNGRIVPIEINATVVKTDFGIHILTLCRDITERKRAEEALHDSELKYRTLFETANDAIFLMDHDVFIDCNPKTLKVFGCTPEQIIGQPPYRFSPDVQPDGRNSREKALEKINAAFTGQPQFFEWQHSRYDGTLFNAEVNLNVLSIAGKDCLVAIVRDITERKRAEEALRISEDKFAKVFQASPDIIVLTSLNDGRLVEVNERLKDATGYSYNEVIGKRTNELQFWVDTAERDRYIALLMRDGRVRDLEVKFRIKSGEVRDTLISGEIIELQDGKYILGVIRDITERKRAEDNLCRRAEELATLLKISQEFALTRDLKIILQMTTDRVTELTQLKSSAIYLLEGETLRLWATTPPLPPQFPEELRNASLADHPHIRKAITTGMPVFLPDTATADLTPAERAVTELRSLLSILYIPLIAGTKALGTLIVTATEEPRILSDAEINFCNTLANIAAMAIENAILDEEIRKNVEALQQEILNRKRSAVEIKKMNEQLRALAVRLQTIREEERTTIAREIHDELGQMLTGLKYELMWIEKRIDPGQDDMRSKVAEIQVLIDSTIKTVRKISAELRPGILDLGLAAAIEWQAGEFRRRTGIGGRTEINDTGMQMRENTSTQVFRIFQEILTNIMRHANASKVDIILKRLKNDLILIVSDNGKGMHPGTGPDEQSLGLLGMQERTIIFGGTLSISSAYNQGTTIEVLIPIEHSKQ